MLLPSRVQLFATAWTATYQASLSFTVSWSLLKLMSIALVRPSNPLIFCHSLLLLPSNFSSIRVFSSELILNDELFPSGGQSFGASASASVLPVNIQGWFTFGLTGLISLQSKGLPRVFFSTPINNLGNKKQNWENVYHRIHNERESLLGDYLALIEISIPGVKSHSIYSCMFIDTTIMNFKYHQKLLIYSPASTLTPWSENQNLFCKICEQ